jgi:hypothetical protein
MRVRLIAIYLTSLGTGRLTYSFLLDFGVILSCLNEFPTVRLFPSSGNLKPWRDIISIH